MNIYEISNPSDAYTIRGEKEAVCAAALFLGDGLYGIRNEHESVMPPFFGDGFEDFWRKNFSREFKDYISQNRGEIAAALDTVLIGNFKEREEFESALALLPEHTREAWAAKWKDGHRSSLNNIGARAAQFAEAIRAKQKELAQ